MVFAAPVAAAGAASAGAGAAAAGAAAAGTAAAGTAAAAGASITGAAALSAGVMPVATGAASSMAAVGATGFSWGTALTYASMGMSAFSAISGGMQQNQMAKYNAAIAQNQAIAARYQAEQQTKVLERQKRQLLGKQATSYAKKGLLFDEGTPADVMAETIEQYELDKANAIYNGNISASAANSQAALDREQGRVAQKTGLLSAVKTGAKAAGTYYNSTLEE